MVKYGGRFVWNLEIIKCKDFYLHTGIIPNEENVLTENKTAFVWYRQGWYIWNLINGTFGSLHGSWIYSKGKKLVKEGDILQIKFDWKENSLHYIANGEDLWNALDIGSFKEFISDDTT